MMHFQMIVIQDGIGQEQSTIEQQMEENYLQMQQDLGTIHIVDIILIQMH